jgi:hypothetical protein
MGVHPVNSSFRHETDIRRAPIGRKAAGLCSDLLIRRTQEIGKKSYPPTKVATVKFFNFNKILLGSFCEENCTVKLWGTKVQFDNQNGPPDIGAWLICGASAAFAAYSLMAYMLATALWRWKGETTLISDDRRLHLSSANVRA